jgi:hypothetical protein
MIAAAVMNSAGRTLNDGVVVGPDEFMKFIDRD